MPATNQSTYNTIQPVSTSGLFLFAVISWTCQHYSHSYRSYKVAINHPYKHQIGHARLSSIGHLTAHLDISNPLQMLRTVTIIHSQILINAVVKRPLRLLNTMNLNPTRNAPSQMRHHFNARTINAMMMVVVVTVVVTVLTLLLPKEVQVIVGLETSDTLVEILPHVTVEQRWVIAIL